MKVKDIEDFTNIKVIDPKSGKVSIFKGNCGDLIFLGTNKTHRCTVFPFYVPIKDFQEWELADPKDKVNIHIL
jgi:hypothetical protein